MSSELERFRNAALSEGGMPIAVGVPAISDAERAEAFRRAALAEAGMCISAGGPDLSTIRAKPTLDDAIRPATAPLAR